MGNAAAVNARKQIIMQGNQGAAHATIDWRDWVAFVGYVLATAVVVSVMLASVVLVLSMQAEPLPATGPVSSQAPAAQTQVPAAPIVTPQPAGPAATERAGEQPPEPAAAPAANASPRIEITSETLRAETPIGQTLQANAATAEAREEGSGASAAVEDTAGAESARAAEPEARAPAIAARPDAPTEAR